MSDNGFVAYLGGESGHRGFFGGTGGRTRTILLGVAFLLLLVLTPGFGLWGLAIGVVFAGVSFLITQRTHRGSILERRTKRQRWKARQATGTARFTPYDADRWDAVTAELAELRKTRGKPAAARRAELGQELAAMRANPDGADGMGWLLAAPNEPGIAWHTPVGETAYLSVAFAVTGPLRGIEGAASIARNTLDFAAFLSQRATAKSLISQVQISTRVLPADTARQEFWVLGNLDQNAPYEAQQSYDEVLRRTGEGAMVQRHFVTLNWPVTPAFTQIAAKYGPGRDGWRALLRSEINVAAAGLEQAHLGPVTVMTARGVSALILNQQNPDRPMDLTRGVEPESFGLPSWDEYSANVVEAHDELTGEPVQWWHRTAAIKAENLAIPGRSPLWAIDLLRGTELACVRTVSAHIALIPAREAKSRAMADLTKDQAAAAEDTKRGRISDDEVTTRATAAKRRKDDLSPGSGFQGAEWIAYVTVSARSRDDLVLACRDLSEVAADGPGIDELEWLDSYQAAASGVTWPIGRGLSSTGPDMLSRATRLLAGRKEKEELV